MGRSGQEINIESAASVAAPVDEVWGLLTRAEAVKHPFVGVDDITFRPDDSDYLQENMEVRLQLGLKVGVVAVRGLVRVRIENLDPDHHYFTASIIEAPLDLQGEATIVLAPEVKDNQHTELLFMGAFTVSRIMAKFISEEKLQHRVDAMMPKVGGLIAKGVQRARDSQDRTNPSGNV